MTQTNPPSPPVPPKVPTGQELFDAIMNHIEPELTSEGLKTLEAKYKGETSEQFERRKKRYVLAYERYDQAYQGYMETLNAQVNRYRKDSIGQVEVEDRMREEGLLSGLDQQILSFS